MSAGRRPPRSGRLLGQLGGNEGLQDLAPVPEHDKEEHGAHEIQHSVPRDESGARRLPFLAAEVAGVLHQEGDHVERRQQAGERFLAVAEVVLQVEAVLQDPEGIVLDLPPRPRASCQFRDGIAADIEVGGERVAVSPLAGRRGDGDLEPVDFQGVLAVPDRQAAHPPVEAMDFFPALAFDGAQRVALNSLNILV